MKTALILLTALVALSVNLDRVPGGYSRETEITEVE